MTNNRRHRHKFAYCLLITVLCVTGCPEGVAGTARAATVTSASIKEKENQISQKKDEKEAMQNSLSDVKKIKQELEAQKNDLKKYVEELDRNLAEIEANILNLKGQINVKEQEIKVSEQELADALVREEFQKESVISCIRLIYETGKPKLWDMLFKAKSFRDFLNQADYVEKIVEYDHRMWQDYKEVREYTELCKQELELEKEILDAAKAGVEAEQKSLEELIEQKSDEITKYESDINNKEKVIKEYEEEIKSQEEEIKALEAAVAEEKKQLLANSALKYDGGMFKFPLASYTRVSSEYGYRIHPILNVKQFHNGVDFAAPKGTAIYAAYDGKVVAAAYSSTMGNYVMINHGDELYTIYMHASALYVKKGDAVVKGETIAAVGSTGRSTGNHLHFTVRLNGAYVSPWDYLKE